MLVHIALVYEEVQRENLFRFRYNTLMAVNRGS
jgi:hypothetical protein